MKDTSTPDLRNLVAACAAITVFGLSFGMTYPLLSLLLELRGVPSNIIGLNAAMMPLGILVCSPLIPVLSARLGARNLAILAAVLSALFTLLYKVHDNLAFWFVLRFFQGMSIVVLFVLSEAWVVGYAGDQHRGKIVAFYASVLSASFGAGPALIGVIGVEGWTPFMLGSIVLLLGITPLFWLRLQPDDADDTESHTSLLAFIPKAPMLIAAVGCFSIFDAATLSLLPVYGVRNGLSVSTASWALAALILGNMFLQLPIGWLADKYSPRNVLNGCAAITVVMTLLVPFVINTVWMLSLIHI